MASFTSQSWTASRDSESRRWSGLGAKTFGDRTGILYSDETPEGYHKDHLVFIWEGADGHRYSASLHTWDRLDEAITMLSVLVAGLDGP